VSIRITLLALAGLVCTLPAMAQSMAPAGPTLTAVRARNNLDRGAHPGAPGFGVMDSRGVYTGFEADTCRAIAAVVLGDASRIRWFVLTSAARLAALQSGQIDVLARTTTWTQSRDTANELNLADWARSNRITIRPVVFEQNDEMRIAYESGRCDAFSTDASQLAGVRSALPRPADHMVLPDIISKEPLAVAVRRGDDQWFDIVRWTIFALIEAEEFGVTQANVDQMLRSERPEIRRLPGVLGDHGPFMGLDRRWAYNAIKAVGNYGEIFERHLGRNTPIGLARGINDLWTRGGLMYAPPIR